MSRSITLTDAQIEEFAEEFKKELKKSRFVDSDIKVSKTLPKSTERAKIVFSPRAWLKQTILLDNCDKEVAWHGVVDRATGEDNVYLISDVVVYPQTVTSSTVDMDTEEYAKWIQKNDGDERFNKLLMQAHSHVNMGVTPSSTDIKHQVDIMHFVDDNSFYIFMIYNKRREHYVRIFDLQKNIAFDTADVDVMIAGVDGFFRELHDNVVERRYTYQSSYDWNSRGGSENRPWYNYETKKSDTTKTENVPSGKPITKLEPKTEKKQEEKSAPIELSDGKKKGV